MSASGEMTIYTVPREYVVHVPDAFDGDGPRVALRNPQQTESDKRIIVPTEDIVGLVHDGEELWLGRTESQHGYEYDRGEARKKTLSFNPDFQARLAQFFRLYQTDTVNKKLFEYTVAPMPFDNRTLAWWMEGGVDLDRITAMRDPEQLRGEAEALVFEGIYVCEEIVEQGEPTHQELAGEVGRGSIMAFRPDSEEAPLLVQNAFVSLGEANDSCLTIMGFEGAVAICAVTQLYEACKISSPCDIMMPPEVVQPGEKCEDKAEEFTGEYGVFRFPELNVSKQLLKDRLKAMRATRDGFL